MAMVIVLRAEETMKIVTSGIVEITLDGKYGRRAKLVVEGEPRPNVSVVRELTSKDKPK